MQNKAASCNEKDLAQFLAPIYHKVATAIPQDGWAAKRFVKLTQV
jgi:hypothetical protein